MLRRADVWRERSRHALKELCPFGQQRRQLKLTVQGLFDVRFAKNMQDTLLNAVHIGVGKSCKREFL